MKRILAVYDVDADYTLRFADFVNRRDTTPFTVIPFTSVESLREYGEKNSIEILLVGEEAGKEAVSGVRAKHVMVLSGGTPAPYGENIPGVYKYQSAEGVVRDLMACYCDSPLEPSLTVLTKKADVIGVYSPVNRCLKTSFSLTLGQLMARDSKVLYLNLEEYSGLEILMNENYKGGLSDVLYFYQQGEFNWMRLSAFVYSWGSMDYVPPVCFPEDLDMVGGEEMAELLTRIAAESPYEILIVDVGQFGKKALEVLDVCALVYMPVKEDCVSAAKLGEFEGYVRTAGRERLLERIQKLKLPYHRGFGRMDNYVEQLVWGELGDYVRELLKGKAKTWES